MSEIEKLADYVTDSASRAELLAAADIPTVYARDELPTLEFGGVRLHSAVRPSAEAESLPETVESEIRLLLQHATTAGIRVIALGPGLGYVVKAVDRLLNSAARDVHAEIVCVEI